MSRDRLPMDVPDADLARPAEAEPVPAAERGSEVDGDRVREEYERREAAREESRGRQLANLEPDQAPIRHAVYARQGMYLRCERCPVGENCELVKAGQDCPKEIEYERQRTAALWSLEWLDPAVDGPAVRALVWCEIRLERAAKYLAAHGEILPAKGGEYTGLAKDVQGLLNTWARMLQALGLTPPERKKMAESGQAGLGDLAAALLGVERRKPEAEEVVEGEFVVEDEGPRTEDRGPENGDGDEGR